MAATSKLSSLFAGLVAASVTPFNAKPAKNDSTNNNCERVLREAVIHRKIRGLLRNGKGMRMFGNIMTVVITWKLRGMNPLEEVRKYL